VEALLNEVLLNANPDIDSVRVLYRHSVRRQDSWSSSNTKHCSLIMDIIDIKGYYYFPASTMGTRSHYSRKTWSRELSETMMGLFDGTMQLVFSIDAKNRSHCAVINVILYSKAPKFRISNSCIKASDSAEAEYGRQFHSDVLLKIKYLFTPMHHSIPSRKFKIIIIIIEHVKLQWTWGGRSMSYIIENGVSRILTRTGCSNRCVEQRDRDSSNGYYHHSHAIQRLSINIQV